MQPTIFGNRRARGVVGCKQPTLRILAVLLLAGLLAGCGKKGAPSAPGPSSEIIYPRSYPTR